MVSRGVYSFKDTDIAASDIVIVKIGEDTSDDPITMPENISTEGYSIYISTRELKTDDEAYDASDFKEFDNVIKVDPVYSINLAADTYRNVTGSLGSTDLIFSAVVNHNGNIASVRNNKRGTA